MQNPPASTQPAERVEIQQDTATLLAKLTVAMQANTEATAKLIDISSQKTVTYGSDVWLGREIAMLAFLLLAYLVYTRSKRAKAGEPRVCQSDSAS